LFPDITVDQEEAAKVTDTTYAKKKAKEEAEKAEKAAIIPLFIPSALKRILASEVNELLNESLNLFDRKNEFLIFSKKFLSLSCDSYILISPFIFKF
jgi:hypothetical protein